MHYRPPGRLNISKGTDTMAGFRKTIEIPTNESDCVHALYAAAPLIGKRLFLAAALVTVTIFVYTPGAECGRHGTFKGRLAETSEVHVEQDGTRWSNAVTSSEPLLQRIIPTNPLSLTADPDAQETPIPLFEAPANPKGRGGASNGDCSNSGLWSNLTPPSGMGVFLADFAYNGNTHQYAVLEVGGSDEIFKVTAGGGVVAGSGVHPPEWYYSGRGCSYHNWADVYFCSSWNWFATYALDSSFNVIASTYDGWPGAGNAVDEEENLLYQSTNSNPDYLVEYSINADNTITQRRYWVMPWGCGSDGYDMAALNYENASGYFYMINQYANALEWFYISGNYLYWAGCCNLAGVSFGWGFGIGPEITIKVVDISSFSPPFPVSTIVSGAPLADVIESFEGYPLNHAILLEWVTTTEINLIGFDIYRAEAEKEEYFKINQEIIFANFGDPEGYCYHWFDRNLDNDKSYWYILAVTYGDGHVEYEAPIEVITGQPVRLAPGRASPL